MAAREIATLAVDSGPYKFLDYFLEQDQSTYAGRERDVREIVARATTGRSLVVYGRSGLGKTSLLLAGVFPVLRKRGFTPVYVRTLESPVDDLRQALVQLLDSSPRDLDEKPEIADLVRRLGSSGPVLLVLDQFEEFFIRFSESPADRQIFISTLEDLTKDPELSVRVIFSLREDYLANLGEFRSGFPFLFRNEHRLMPLTAFGARRAIVQPLIAHGISYDAGLVSRLVDLLAEEEFDPVLLQIVCTEVYRQAMQRTDEELHLREDDFRCIAGLETVFERYLDKALRGVPRERHLVVRAVLDSLITLDRTKRAVTEDHFRDAEFSTEPQEVEDVLGFLKVTRLVREEQRGHKVWYELAHDRVVGPALEWINQDRDFFNYREARNLIVNAARSPWRDNPKLLLTKGQLEDVVGPFEPRLSLDAEQTEMVVQSAIYSGSDQITVWKDRFERICGGVTDRAIREFIEGKSKTGRIGALIAIRRLHEAGRSWAGRCFTIALEDDDADVRFTAGNTLCAIGGQEEGSRLRRALRSSDPTKRQRARELAAQIYQEPGIRMSLGMFDRRRAARAHHRRQQRAHRELIDARSRAGALEGLLGGVAWTATVWVVLATIGFWVVLEIEVSWLFFVGSSAGFALAVALIAGAFLGWRLSARSGIFAARNTKTTWYRLIVGSFAYHAILFPLAFWIAVVLADELVLTQEVVEKGRAAYLGAVATYCIVLPVVLTLAVVRCVALAAHLARPAITSCRSAAKVWGWSALASLGLGLLIPIAIHASLFLGTRSVFDSGGVPGLFIGAYFFVWFLFPLLSFLVFVSCASLARSESRVQIESSEYTTAASISGRRSRSVLFCLLGLGLFVSWFVFFYGVGAVPIKPARPLPEPGSVDVVSARLGPGIPGVVYLRLKPPTRWPVLMEVRSSADLELYIDRREVGSNRVFVDRPVTAAFYEQSEEDWLTTLQAQIELSTRQIPYLTKDEPFDRGKSRHYRIPFSRAPESSWNAKAAGQVTPLDPDQLPAILIRQYHRQPDLSLVDRRGSILVSRGEASCEAVPSVPSVPAVSGTSPPTETQWLARVDADGSWECNLEFRTVREPENPQSASTADALMVLERLEPGNVRWFPRLITGSENTDLWTQTPPPSSEFQKSQQDTPRLWWRWEAPTTGKVSFAVYALLSGTLEIADENGLIVGRARVRDQFGSVSGSVEQGSPYLVSLSSSRSGTPDVVGLAWSYSQDPEDLLTEDLSSAAGQGEAPMPSSSSEVVTVDSLENPPPLGDDLTGTLLFDTREAPRVSGTVFDTPSLWWEYESAVLGRVEFSTEGSEFDTVLAVLDENGSTIQRDDDGGPNQSSRLNFVVAPGTRYRIGVAGYGTQMGRGVLLWSFEPLSSIVGTQPATNNQETHSLALYIDDEYDFGSTLGAGLEPDEPFHAGQDSTSSVWWSWTPIRSMLVEIELLSDQNMGAVIAVYEGVDPSERRTVAASGPGNPTTRVLFEAEMGHVYRIAVASMTEGYFALRLRER